MRLLRELSRRKLRTTLTITGITIGIWALVVFSSMANQINGLVGMGSAFYADKIVVTDGEAFGTSPMRLADAEIMAGLDGVAAVQPKVEILWVPTRRSGSVFPTSSSGSFLERTRATRHSTSISPPDGCSRWRTPVTSWSSVPPSQRSSA